MISAIPAGRFALWGVVYIHVTNTWGEVSSSATQLLVKSGLHRNWALKGSMCPQAGHLDACPPVLTCIMINVARHFLSSSSAAPYVSTTTEIIRLRKLIRPRLNGKHCKLKVQTTRKQLRLYFLFNDTLSNSLCIASNCWMTAPVACLRHYVDMCLDGLRTWRKASTRIIGVQADTQAGHFLNAK